MPTETILAGKPAYITTAITAHDTPAGPPTATVCITDAVSGELVETLTETVALDGDVVTVTATWQIPDTQTGGAYIATIDIDGTIDDADEILFNIQARRHTDPHPP